MQASCSRWYEQPMLVSASKQLLPLNVLRPEFRRTRPGAWIFGSGLRSGQNGRGISDAFCYVSEAGTSARSVITISSSSSNSDIGAASLPRSMAHRAKAALPVLIAIVARR